MVNLKLHIMKISELCHASFQISCTVGITAPHILYKPCQLVAVIRIDIDYIITDFVIHNRLIDKSLLPAVYKLVCALTRDSHDIFLSLAGKEKGAVGHSLFEYCDINYISLPHIKRLADSLNCFRLQMV